MTKDEILAKYRSRKTNYTWDIYQPIPFPGFEETYQYSGRKCTDRLAYIVERIRQRFGDKKIRILDIGCNMGYFVFELAKLGHQVVGMDSDNRYIDLCCYLKNNFYIQDNKPEFICHKITKEDLSLINGFDLVLCFSVIHHFKDRFSFLKVFASRVSYCYLEIDGKDYGEFELKTFYRGVSLIGEANDQYGSGIRTRKTWECDNTNTHNIKLVNNILGRTVFLYGNVVVKRSSNKVAHTWLFTDLKHEIEVYKKYPTTYFPRALGFDITSDYTELYLEYIKNIGRPSVEQIMNFYDFLRDNRLFIIDFVRDMFIFDESGKLKVIDLESVFPIEVFKDRSVFKRKDRPIAYDTYEKQIDFLMNLFKLDVDVK